METGMSSSEHSERVIWEEWKDIHGYEGLYQISNYGRGRTVDRVSFQRHWQGGQSRYLHKRKIKKLFKRKDGYVCVNLTKNKKQRTFNVHRLVAIHFLPKVDGKEYVNHIDSNKNNNHFLNLEWCSQSENIQYAYDNGRKIPPHERKVSQFDMNGNFIRVWKSEAEVERALGIFQSNIHKVCKGLRNQAGGYKWQYTE